MTQDYRGTPGGAPQESAALVLDEAARNDVTHELPDSSLGLWRSLQGYLTLDTFVDNDAEISKGRVEVTVRVSNIAPAGEGRPEVLFRSVQLQVEKPGGRESTNLGPMSQGQALQRQYTFRPKELATIEFHVSGEVDPSKFFQIRRKSGMPKETVGPLLKEFSQRFETLALANLSSRP